MTRFALMVPTLNAEQDLRALLPSLARQTQQPDRLLVIDSSSDDATVNTMKKAGAEVHVIARAEFNHGSTRMKAVELAATDCDIIVFLTQDVILHADDALEQLLDVFKNAAVASAYGRQIPHEGANAIERYSRKFNYTQHSMRRTSSDIPFIGFRTCFSSNAFSAFRIKTLKGTGGFPANTIFGEDALAVANLILAGHTHAYVAEASVRHSHSYTLAQEFRRYFDIGVMHAQSTCILRQFGSPASTGKAFVLGELSYLAKHAPLRIPEALLRTMSKYVAYKIGLNENRLSTRWKRRLSMHKRFWSTT